MQRLRRLGRRRVNEWEARGRLVKARKIAALLRRAMTQQPEVVTLARLAAADQQFRDLAAREAGVKPPSVETWEWVLELLADETMPPPAAPNA